MKASEPTAQPRRAAMDWEGFFRDYRRPDFVPGYEILNKLGSGVFGEVYKARKTSIGKLYAIKFLRIQDERIADQVLRELEAVDHFAQVDHPNLVSIEDRGEVCGIPYIVMGYGGEETLKVLLRGESLPRERTLTLFRQVLTGVSALHQHAIIHFDLKPANIFIKGEVARVGDYGLSKLMSESRATLSMGRGTPHYMAPEMLDRRGDARSDVYSLGVILFEMLTGDVPFRGATEWEVLRRHERDLPPIPESLDPALRAVLARTLAKNPDGRYANAGALLAAFDQAIPGGSAAGSDAQAAVAGDGAPSGRRPRARRLLSACVARRAEEMSRRAGHIYGRHRVTVDQLRSEVHELLMSVRAATREGMRAGAAESARRTAGLQAGRREDVRRPASRAWLGLLLLPVHLPARVAWALLSGFVRAVFRVAAFAVLVGVLCVLVHLGLRWAIL
jgi:tRNA A-37 threonylcarbamoyl transferase component Bud32